MPNIKIFSALYFILCISLPTLLLPSCEERLTSDGSLGIVFSEDTVFFDTVFTTAGSSTHRVMLYNPNREAVMIHSVRLETGDAFIVNFDGEQNLSLVREQKLSGGDSLFIFVRADIDPTNSTNPLLVEDKLLLSVGDHTETLLLQAYGWDIEVWEKKVIRTDLTLTPQKPYLIRDYLYIDSAATLTIPAGCHLFMHDTAQIACYGSLIITGTREAPVRIQSDRLDNLFPHIPYLYVGGRWDGLYLVRPDSALLDNVEILSGNIGLYVLGSGKEHITVLNSRIHNHSLYGMVIQDADALIANTEISNCAQYCAYLMGGRHEFVHSTIASYFNSTRYAIQTTARVDSMAPLYINNLSKRHRPTELVFVNSVLAGAEQNSLMLATPLPQYYTGELSHSFLQTDTMRGPYSHDNAYGTRKDTVFVNTFYGDYDHYYDFRLDSVSPARDIADSTVARRFPLDRFGNDRFADGKPDAGCYEWHDTEH
ncbi:MAG: right-handed parallel beta-helix repeat-containing protein [Paludibacteraceae bacterium]|nr:right-handed parallel beta-helix repeat-containing protein [Paludibacteraceae bacterium]